MATQPTAFDIIAAREVANLTQDQAARLVNCKIRAWQRWEAGDRAMHPAFWELFLLKTATHRTLTAITLDALDANLRNEIEGYEGEYAAFELPYGGNNDCHHIVFSQDSGRGGIVFVGSGSSGLTSWTDAESADEVYRRFMADELNG